VILAERQTLHSVSGVNPSSSSFSFSEEDEEGDEEILFDFPRPVLVLCLPEEFEVPPTLFLFLLFFEEGDGVFIIAWGGNKKGL
jgi:hypothetical protein